VNSRLDSAIPFNLRLISLFAHKKTRLLKRDEVIAVPPLLKSIRFPTQSITAFTVLCSYTKKKLQAVILSASRTGLHLPPALFNRCVLKYSDPSALVISFNCYSFNTN